jgi:integrase/recombinase XerD
VDNDSENASPAISILTPARRYDPKLATPFVQKSLSEATRRAYTRALAEFFAFIGARHPGDVAPDDVLAYRDHLRARRRRPATVAFHLSVLRSFFAYLKDGGIVERNPASTRLVPPPQLPTAPAGRALTSKEVRNLLAGPDRSTARGARDYALLLLMVRLGLRVNEACSLRVSSMKWSHGRWTLRFRAKGGDERTLPLPADLKAAIDAYLALDAGRRKLQHSDGADAHMFQPHVNYRTLVFSKSLTPRAVWNVVARWAEFAGVGKLSPHDLRRTVITRALDQGLSYRQVQMMSGHRDPKTVQRYDHGRENLDLNAVNYIDYSDT